MLFCYRTINIYILRNISRLGKFDPIVSGSLSAEKVIFLKKNRIAVVYGHERNTGIPV